RDDAFRREELGERRSLVGALTDRLVVQDDAPDGLLHPGGGEQQLAIEAATLLRRLDADRVETLRDRPGALVGREDPAVVGDDLFRGRIQLLRSHQRAPFVRLWIFVSGWNAAMRRTVPERERMTIDRSE